MTQRKPSIERRAQIARATLKIIGERGVKALRSSGIAREVGVTSGALFRHFESMDDILRETVRLAVAAIEQTFPDESLPPLERLFSLGRKRIQVVGSDAGLAWLLKSRDAHLALPDDAVASLRQLVARSKKTVLGALRDGMLDGSIRNDIEPAVLMVPVMATMHALMGKPATNQSNRAVEIDKVLRALEKMLEPGPKT